MSDLAGSVLPLIRTRRDLHRWSAANTPGRQMHDADSSGIIGDACSRLLGLHARLAPLGFTALARVVRPGRERIAVGHPGP